MRVRNLGWGSILNRMVRKALGRLEGVRSETMWVSRSWEWLFGM